MRSTSFRLAMVLACAIFVASGVVIANAQSAAVARAPHPATTPAPKPQRTRIARLEKPFTLRAGQWAILSDTPDPFGVQFAEMLEDTRCPSDLNCFHGGSVVLDLAFQQDGEVLPEHQSISTISADGENVVSAAGYIVELLEVSPPRPPSDKSLRPDDYRARLVVRAAPEATPTPTPTLEPTPLPTPISSDEDSFVAALAQPFALIPGQTAQIPEEEFSLTLRSLSDNSGCFTIDDCSTMIGDGTIAFKHGEQKELLTFTASFSPHSPFVYEFDGYEVQLLQVMQSDTGAQVATFLVDAKRLEFVAVPDPEWVERCPDFSRFDAAAMLQADVQPEAVANLVFGPLAVDGPVLPSLCGYVSEAFTPERQASLTSPYLATAVEADFAVAAGRLAGTDVLGLLHLFTTVNGADTGVGAVDLAMVQTQLTAGLADNFLATLAASAEENPDVTVKWLENIGDEALWLWTPTADGAFVLLLARDGASFRVVEALVGVDATEAELLDYGLTLLRKL